MDSLKRTSEARSVSIWWRHHVLQFSTYRGSAVRTPEARAASVCDANGTEDDQDPGKHCSYDGQHHECDDLETRNGKSLVYLTRWPLEYMALILKIWFSNSKYSLIALELAAKLLSGECHRTWPLRSQHVMAHVMAWCHKASVDPDPCRHMASQAHNELRCAVCRTVVFVFYNTIYSVQLGRPRCIKTGVNLGHLMWLAEVLCPSGLYSTFQELCIVECRYNAKIITRNYHRHSDDISGT